jgi:putative transposase
VIPGGDGFYFWLIPDAGNRGQTSPMSRLPRFYVEGCPLHVIQRGNNRLPTFGDANDFLFYRTCLSFSARKHQVAVHAYVLMTNHVHALVSPGSRIAVPKMMQSIGRVYVAYFNKRYARTGTLWEGRYKAAVVDTDRYFLTCMRYIEQNPVRAGMIPNAAAYEWSSHRANATGAADDVISRHPLYLELGSCEEERQQAYRAMFAFPVDSGDLSMIRDATQNAWALGAPAFCANVQRHGRRAERIPLGRPIKK